MSMGYSDTTKKGNFVEHMLHSVRAFTCAHLTANGWVRLENTETLPIVVLFTPHVCSVSMVPF